VLSVITVLPTACQQLAQLEICMFWSYIRCLAGHAFSTFFDVQGVVLAATFAVSHNVAEAKPLVSGSATTLSLLTDYQERDWGVQQVCPAPPRTRFCRQLADVTLMSKQWQLLTQDARCRLLCHCCMSAWHTLLLH